MKKLLNPTAVCLACMALIVSGCQKETGEPAPLVSLEQVAGMKQEKKIYVSTVNELYAAVNDPGNAGATVILSPGQYVLDAAYPNLGRLELQEDMSLQGQPGNTAAVLIDESALPGNSFRITPTVSTGGIRAGKGTNRLEWLSIKGGSLAVNPFSVIETDLVGTQTHLVISHVNLDCNGSRIGIMEEVLWVQVRSEDSATANQVLDSIELSGM